MYKRKKTRGALSDLILFLALCLGAPYCQAIWMTDLYTVEVEVADKQPSGRAQSIHLAYQQLLQRLGAPQALETLTHSGGSYVRRFTYDDTQADHLRLRVEFDETRLRGLFQQAKLPIWGKHRPQLLLYVELAPGNWCDQMHELGRQWGIPLTRPLYDLVDANTLEGILDQGAMQQLIQRYGSEGVWYGRLEQQHGRWRAQWHLYVAGREARWESTAPDELTLMQVSTAQLIQTMLSFEHAQRQRWAKSACQQVELMVEGIQSLAQQQAVLDYLQGLENIREVQVAQVSATGVKYQLSYQGEEGDLRDIFALDGVLSDSKMTSTGPSSSLTYSYAAR